MAVSSFYSRDYYRKREQAERTLADQAASPAIRDIHLEMAERYRELAEQSERADAIQPVIDETLQEVGSASKR